ncbi:F0F1 ATP synthase subunit delta [Helicobacter heilmannii]|uniref:F0F1 ATP synthase subunit delta n=2 Tax=Helicobacter heilmannii TaxID=35817 RepID=UPI0006A1693E|nr:F0F1 ATP synthase subunit delta [Helicobacter heilmannii]CRF48052.1 ATP synthase delta chain [Helicobacter heilmannii]CRF51419.1 ATP synthase delta chain [Helicobacter heilmannii]
MLELIAAKYTHALRQALNPEELTQAMEALEALCALYSHPDFLGLIDSPHYPDSLKQEVLECFLKDKEDKLHNLIRLLVLHKRLNLLPLIYNSLRSQAQRAQNIYQGYLYSDQELSLEQVQRLASEVSAYFNISLKIKALHQAKEGVRLVIPDLETEIAFYKENYFNQLRQYILQAV